MEYILDFDKLNKNSVNRVGGKNAGLGELINAGIRVPPGFAITADSYLEFITETGINEHIFRILSDMMPGDIRSQDAAGERIQELIRAAAMPHGIRGEIDAAYHQLCEACRVSSVPVAVRSSATAEDLPTASFAGQQDTYLWVRDADQVAEKVRRCWAGLFTPRAIDYRIKNDFPHEKVLISVGIQQMVNARAAGVMFTLNPTDGDPSKVVIEGNWGLGETVVSGSVNPDKFVVDKVVKETTDKTISEKHIECIFDPEKGRVINAKVAPERRNACCLEDREVKQLMKLAKTIESHYGRPMDIEWSIDGDLSFPESIFIVQARPETVWSLKKQRSRLGGKSGYQLLMDQAMKRVKVPS